MKTNVIQTNGKISLSNIFPDAKDRRYLHERNYQREGLLYHFKNLLSWKNLIKNWHFMKSRKKTLKQNEIYCFRFPLDLFLMKNISNL